MTLSLNLNSCRLRSYLGDMGDEHLFLCYDYDAVSETETLQNFVLGCHHHQCFQQYHLYSDLPILKNKGVKWLPSLGGDWGYLTRLGCTPWTLGSKLRVDRMISENRSRIFGSAGASAIISKAFRTLSAFSSRGSSVSVSQKYIILINRYIKYGVWVTLITR